MIEVRVLPGVQHADIRPTYRPIHRPHIEVRAAIWNDVGQPSAGLLPIINIPQVLPGEGSKVEKIASGLKEDLCITGPGVALPGGTIGGNIQVISLGGPNRSIYQGIDQRVGAIKKSDLLQIRVYRNGCKVFRLDLKICFYQRIPEAKDCKGRFILVQALLAGVFHLL